MIAITEVNNKLDHLDLAISPVGNYITGFLVCLLLVSRVHSGVSRSREGQICVEQMNRNARELMHHTVVFSRKYKNKQQEAKEWRSEIAYRIMLVLRTTVAIIEYPNDKIPAWQLPELSSGLELQACKPGTTWNRWAHHNDNDSSSSNESEFSEGMLATDLKNSFRIPIRLTFLLRESICSQNERLGYPLVMDQELKLLEYVDRILEGYYGVRRLMTTTPSPLMLVQISRALLYLYIFTVPFVLLSDEASIIANCATTFMLTYGLISLQCLANEFEGNPFGRRLGCLALAHTVFEDLYHLIGDTDGCEWADSLRYKMHDNSAEPLPTEKSWLVAKIV